jgi:hypothetical protein
VAVALLLALVGARLFDLLPEARAGGAAGAD